MASSARLKYRIVKCTSEDPEFPVSELLSHSSQTKGWQTARFCDFPQEIGLQFETPVHLRQVQFLSHQSKIATKIELFTALPASGQAQQYDSVQFKRLGYLSLDSNERSQFQARELKSVYVDVSTQFLRVLFHKCHVNRYNIVNQVGLIALNCLGEALGPDLAMGPPPPNPLLSRGPVAGQPYQQPNSQPAAVPQPFQAPQESQLQHAGSGLEAGDEQRYDGRTLERIRSLTTAKNRAVEAEDYEEAKRCKEMIARLRQTGLLLRELEDRKRTAVQNEDFDAAKALKVEIERLRQAIEKPEQAPVSRSSARPPSVGNAGVAPRGGHQPMASGFQSPEPDSGAPSYNRRSPSPSAAGPSKGRRSPSFRPEPSDEDDDDFQPMSHGPPPARRDAAASPPLPANGGARAARRSPQPAVSPSPVAARGGHHLVDEDPPDAGPHFDAANHPLRGVPNVEDLPQPEPLNPTLQKEAEGLVSLFGEYITRCIYSKTWNLRDAAVQKITLDFQAGAYSNIDHHTLVAGFIQVLKRMFPDKNVLVFLASATLLQATCDKLLGARSQFRKAEVHSMFEGLLPLLVERLGDSNARVDKTARDAHLDLARCPNIGAPFTASALLRPIKKKSVSPRVFVSRLQLLTALVTEAGIQPDSKDGLPLDPTMALAMDWFNNASADVRESAVKLVAACYAHVGLQRIEKYLANVRQAQREIFEQEFEKVDSGEGLGAGSNDGLATAALPPPQVPPPRRAGGGQSSSRQIAAPTGMSQEQGDEGEDETGQCQFCGLRDPSLTAEAMDVHYWRDCPMLIQCEFCQQVIEICTLASHLAEECDGAEAAQEAAQDIKPNACPLCHTKIGSSDESKWRTHLVSVGCAKNPRNKFREVVLQKANHEAA